MKPATIGLLAGAFPAALLVGAPAVAAPSTGAREAATKTVVLKDIEFKPATRSVKRGEQVTWSWRDGDTPHNVASRGSKKFKSSPTKTQGTYRVRFTRKGTYRYVCTIHPGMAGKVVVK